jgi:hypothetical protein
LDQFYPNGIFLYSEPKIEILTILDVIEISDFLVNLKSKIYVVSFEFITNIDTYDVDLPNLILSKPVLITTNSNPDLLMKFLRAKIELAFKTFYLDEDLIEKLSNSGVLIKYKPINLF